MWQPFNFSKECETRENDEKNIFSTGIIFHLVLWVDIHVALARFYNLPPYNHQLFLGRKKFYVFSVICYSLIKNFFLSEQTKNYAFLIMKRDKDKKYNVN